MIVTIHQPEHMPWLGFFDKMRQADMFVLLDTTQFAKDDFQNRNRIKSCNGPAWLTVPVFKSGASTQLIAEARICNDRDWRRRCWRLIYENYRDAPHFAEHERFFQELYGRQWSALGELNIVVLEYLKAQLGLKTGVVTASGLGIRERGGTNTNFAICRAVGAHVYLSGKYGRGYLDERQFAEHGIQVVYQDFQHPVYPQLWGDFVPNMSVIDLLLNCGPMSLGFIEQANRPARRADNEPEEKTWTNS
jgi:WbqC-like protein family